MTDTAKAARDCVEATADLIRRFGPRLAGSDACRGAARALAADLEGSCDRVALERFELHPLSFYSYTKLLPLAWALGAAALFLPGAAGDAASVVAAIGLVAGEALMLCQFAFYTRFPDFLFPRREGLNVSAVVEPRGKAERELILGAHHDSAPLARIFSSPFARYYAIAVFAPYLFFLLELVLLVARLAGAAAPPAWAIAALAAGLPFVLGYFLLVDTGKGAPGAGDNLVSSAMIVSLARELSSEGGRLESTRLRVVSFDGEEAGLRGSAAWFRARAGELGALPCSMLNFDSIYALKDLQVLTSDVNGMQPLSAEMAAELAACAAAEGYATRPFAMLFGGGATDAAEGARAGIRASSIIAMPTEVVREGLVYHTPRDTPDRIEPEAVEACLRIALAFAARLDGRGGAAVRPRNGT